MGCLASVMKNRPGLLIPSDIVLKIINALCFLRFKQLMVIDFELLEYSLTDIADQAVQQWRSAVEVGQWSWDNRPDYEERFFRGFCCEGAPETFHEIKSKLSRTLPSKSVGGVEMFEVGGAHDEQPRILPKI